MKERPALTPGLGSETFLEYYYLKEELVRFCRDNKLPSSGGKPELTERIAVFLKTGKVIPRSSPAVPRGAVRDDEITCCSLIEKNFVCSEKHRAFFREHIGDGFKFNVAFQKWLKANTGKTYGDAIAAYHAIAAEKKTAKTEIGRQFEYNAYIRDFFADNKGMPLSDAIKCWKYKKSLPGHNRYERSDLAALEE